MGHRLVPGKSRSVRSAGRPETRRKLPSLAAAVVQLGANVAIGAAELGVGVAGSGGAGAWVVLAATGARSVATVARPSRSIATEEGTEAVRTRTGGMAGLITS